MTLKATTKECGCCFSLFDEYKPHNLRIWYCFTDTSVKEIIEEKTIVRFIDLFAGIGGIRLGLEQAEHSEGFGLHQERITA